MDRMTRAGLFCLVGVASMLGCGTSANKFGSSGGSSSGTSSSSGFSIGSGSQGGFYVGGGGSGAAGRLSGG